MDIKLSKKQNEKLVFLIKENKKLSEELQINSQRQRDLIDIILEMHDINIDHVKNLNVNDEVLTVELINT